MEGVLPTIALITVVASVGVITVAAHFRADRAGELRAWACDQGWDYADEHPAPLGRAVLPIGAAGGSRNVHVLTGRRGEHGVTAFEHVSATADPGAPRTHRVVAVRTPETGAELEIRRREPATGTAHTRTPFTRAFRTTGEDSEFARSVLEGPVASWLLSDTRSRALPVRFTGGYVLTWAPMRLDPERALIAADYLIDLLEHIPRTSWARPPGGPGPEPACRPVSEEGDRIRHAPIHKE